MGFPFSVNLEVSLPKGWVTIASGKKLSEQLANGRAVSRWSSPMDTDIVVVASPKFKVKKGRYSDIDVEIYYTQLPERFINSELAQLAQLVQLFTTYLGESNIPVKTVKHVYSPKRLGQGRAGFARSGMIVTSEGRTIDALNADAGFSLFQDIAHEVAHFWWNFGAGQGDWINEAFAEYFSAVAVEKTKSQADFYSVLGRYERSVAKLPPDAPSIATATFEGPSSFVVRYYKGSLMLDQFRRTLGDKDFFADVREFYQTYKGKPIGTDEFRNFWKTKLGDKAAMVDQWLDSQGGAPKTAEQPPSAPVPKSE